MFLMEALQNTEFLKEQKIVKNVKTYRCKFDR